MGSASQRMAWSQEITQSTYGDRTSEERIYIPRDSTREKVRVVFSGVPASKKETEVSQWWARRTTDCEEGGGDSVTTNQSTLTFQEFPTCDIWTTRSQSERARSAKQAVNEGNSSPPPVGDAWLSSAQRRVPTRAGTVLWWQRQPEQASRANAHAHTNANITYL